MDETRRLEWIICHFQARARGYLFRKELRRAREDYEDIVKEIDGDLRCLKWTKRVVHFPYFVDTDHGLFQNNKIHDNFENAKSEGTECPGSAEFGSSREEDDCGFSEKLEAERDISQTLPPRELLPSSSGDMVTGGGDVREKEEGVTETPCDTTTVWSSVDTDLGSSHSTKAALRQYCLARDVPRTPQALCVHRNTLSMELLWLQQAIHSRKKYLSLKKQLSVS